MNKIKLNFILNGEYVEIYADPSKRLLDLLRDECDCKSVKEGCSEGECGTCTVIRNGEAVTSCCVLSGQIQGDEIITTEGLRKDEKLDDLQKAFIESGAVQCGFCTPGMLMSAKALIMKNPNPSKEEMRRAISGNLCRCTGYSKIIEAIDMTIKE